MSSDRQRSSATRRSARARRGRQPISSMFGGAAKMAPKSEAELSAEELALGPEIAGRVLGARPLWNNPKHNSA